ncbi:AP-3 complex subunit delta [Paratrimastix pyriformis]|uniref:AP-3 complex subunit delta n=1 Tax=Paratrimastix pyriformis TaxID=342808 RepID=A0ABQ9YMM5_9EUKA|nr:AP-3 complex subunit delta [Paratrimastix pyriformis]
MASAAPIFSKTLNDLVKGIRSNKKNEVQYINSCIQEIKDELRNARPPDKGNAIQKLTYVRHRHPFSSSTSFSSHFFSPNSLDVLSAVALQLHMLGYDMSWASFHVVEVMSQSRFWLKRSGCLAASQFFEEENDCIMLTTQQLKKDFQSHNQFEAGLALNCLANICNAELGRNLVSDVVAMLNSSNPFLRKKAVLALYKILLKVPTALRPAFPRLKEKLEDESVDVCAAAVNVITELAYKNPKNVLPLVPVLFKLLTTNGPTNTWMQIKIVKVMGLLLPIEPRLPKKLVDPLTNLITTTHAKSLQYECINTVVMGCTEFLPLVRLCVDKLKEFVEHQDQNLKYLGLLGLYNIMKAHPKAVVEHRQLVITCLEDADVSIRLRALDLLSGMVTRKNIQEVVRHLLNTLATSEGIFRQAVTEKIIQVAAQENYKHVPDFEWLVATLLQLSVVANVGHGDMIARQLLDIMMRVRAVRETSVSAMLAYLEKMPPESLTVSAEVPGGGPAEVVSACAWCIGEYCSCLAGSPEHAVRVLLAPCWMHLPAHPQATLVLAAMKIAAHSPAILDMALLRRRLAAAQPTLEESATDAVPAGPVVDAVDSGPAAVAPAPAASAQPKEAPKPSTGDLLLQFSLGTPSTASPASSSAPLIPVGPAASGADSAATASIVSLLTGPATTPDASTPATAPAAPEAAPATPAEAPAAAEAQPQATPAGAAPAQSLSDLLFDTVTVYSRSPHMEVQERACFFLRVLTAVAGLADLMPLFADELKAVAPDAQKRVPLPEGLDLDAPINPQPPEDDFAMAQGDITFTPAPPVLRQEIAAVITRVRCLPRSTSLPPLPTLPVGRHSILPPFCSAPVICPPCLGPTGSPRPGEWRPLTRTTRSTCAPRARRARAPPRSSPPTTSVRPAHPRTHRFSIHH